MNRITAFTLGVIIVAASLLPALASGEAALAAGCPTPAATVSVPVTVIIPDLGQGTTGGDTPTPAPTGCATTAPATPGGSSGSGDPGAGDGGSKPGGGAVAPAAPAGPGGEVVAPTPPSTPSKNAAKLDLDPQRLAAHEWMTATGDGYTAGEQVQFVMYPGADVIGSYLADTSGNVTVRFRIPDETRPGAHVVEATGWASKRVSNGEFTVITEAGTGAIPTLWWVIILCSGLFVGLLVLAIYFRRNIARALRGGPETVGSTL